MDITQTLGSGEKSKFLPAIASFTLFATNYRLMLMMTSSDSTHSKKSKNRKSKRVGTVCWDISWCNIEMAYIVSAQENRNRGDAVCIKLKRPSLLERPIKDKAKKAAREKKMRQKRPEKFLFREDEVTRIVPLGTQSTGNDDESLYRWICDQILVYSRTYGKVYIVSQASSKESSDGAERRRSDELGEDSSEDEGDLVLFSDSDSLSAERILREEGGEFTSESEDLDGDFDDDEGDERQERGLDWELEEDKILPTIGTWYT